MGRVVWIAVSAALLLDANVPQVMRLKAPRTQPVEFPPGESLPVLPDLTPTTDEQKPAKKADQLQPESRLALVRYVSGEFARAVEPLPGGKKPFRIKVGQALDEKALRQAVSLNGPAVSTGDTVQITKLEFHDKEIVVDLNGGARGKTRWRDRISISMSGAPMPQVTTTTTSPNGTPAPGYQPRGATIVLDFGRPLPDMTPDELKHYLSAVLDFSKQRSAAVQWVETLPPEMQKAIQEKRAVVGMDREMVLAALGRPEHKVREHDAEGMETEDWIYGQPPGKTVFVKFAGDRVVSVRQFP
jgi:sulfur carrier protein ThiS